MRYRFVILMVILVAAIILLIANAAGAWAQAPATTTTTEATRPCPGWDPPLAMVVSRPCPVPTTVSNPTPKTCLGYARLFAPTDPCPKPPDDVCKIAKPAPYECSAPERPPAVPDVPDPKLDAPTTATTSPIETEVGEALKIVKVKPIVGPPKAKPKVRATTATVLDLSPLVAFYDWVEANIAPLFFSMVP